MKRVTIKCKPSIVEIDFSETALVVIDVQRDFVCAGGYGEFLGNDVNLLRVVIEPIRRLLDAWRRNKLLVIHTREGHKADMSDCPDTKLSRWPAGHRIGDSGPMGRILIIGEEGQDIVPELKPLPGELVIDKPGKNAFIKTNLDEILKKKGIKNLLIAGVTTDVCCFTTTTGANDYGYNAIILEDCVASYNPSRHRAAIDIITAQGGIFGWSTTSDTLLEALNAASSDKLQALK